MKRRSILITLGIGVAIFTVVVLIFTFSSYYFSFTRNDSLYGGSELLASSNDVITGTDDIPIYPGATTYFVTEDAELIATGDIQYHAYLPDNSFTQAVTYYKEWLNNNDWVISEVSNHDQSLLWEATWTNKKEGPPSRRYLVLGLQKVLSGQPEMNMWHQRWPDPNKLPIMPQAQQLKVSWDKHPAYNDLRVTEYLVDLAPLGVQNYYKATLPNYGWGETQLEDHLVGIAYRGKDSTVVVDTMPGALDMTLVKLQVYGAGIMPPAK